MRLLTGIKAGLAVILLSTIATVDLSAIAAVTVESSAIAPVPEITQTPEILIAQARRRLRFRTGVRPSRYRVGGFSRGNCGKQQLTALVPPAQAQEQVAANAASVDKTTADHPTFFAHLPELPATNAQFTLQTEAPIKQLYSVKFKTTGKPGIIGISLPKSAPALKVGQKYFWQMSVDCDVNDAADKIVLSSWVERVKPPTISATTSADNRLVMLAEQGVWQDTLTALAFQRYQQPNDRNTADDWAAVMQDAGLPQFKQATIVQLIRN
jgi:hypothetical protein